MLDFLQGAGVVEISRLEEPEGSDFQRPDTSARRQSCERDAWTAEQALEVLDQYAPEKTSLLSGLAGKPPGFRRRICSCSGKLPADHGGREAEF